MKHLILGPPGTGKTTKLMSIMEDAFARGITPDRIAFVSFTRRALKEAKDRMARKFNLQDSDMGNFRTLHSFAFAHLGLSKNTLFTKRDYVDLGEKLGLPIGKEFREEEDFNDLDEVLVETGDQYIFMDGLARNKCIPIEELWEQLNPMKIGFLEMKHIAEALGAYMQQIGKLDYTGILERFCRGTFERSFDLLLIDEAQDLSRLQWKMAEKLMANSKEVYIAGDDDQAIYKWAGADVETFINLQVDDTLVLDKSYRLPKEIYALSQTISERIMVRHEKPFVPADHRGSIAYIFTLDELDLDSGSWLILCRTNFGLRTLLKQLGEMGKYFSYGESGPATGKTANCIRAYKKLQRGEKHWSIKKSLYRVCDMESVDLSLPWQLALSLPKLQIEKFDIMEKAGVDFFAPPKIRVSTIHAVKGAEADNVVLSLESSRTIWEEMNICEDDEMRVLYVAVTRTKKNLFLIYPDTKYYYEL